MSDPSIIIGRLRHAGINQAAIIDDVFDGPAFIDIQARLDAFRENVEDDDVAFRELREKYGVGYATDVNIDIARRLCGDFADLGDSLRTRAEFLLTEYFARRQPVTQIETHLRALGIEVTCYGKIDSVAQLPPDSVRLVMLDYSLSPDAEEPSAASEWCAARLCERKEKRPFLVLISDRPDAEAHKNSFRAKTRQLGGTFAFIRKQDAQQAGALYLQMAAWGLGHPAHTHIQAFVEAVIDSMDDTIEQFKETLRELTVQDYSFMQRITLEEDGQPLGDYILEFLTGLLSHQFRGNYKIQFTRQALDRLSFDRHLASVKQPSRELAKMYRLSLTDPVFGDVALHPHDSSLEVASRTSIATRAYHIWMAEGCPVNCENEHWYKAERQFGLPLLTLGDIFSKDAQSELLMVVNAACDLLFSPRSSERRPRPDQPIYLIPGILTDLRATGDIGSKEVTELFEFGGNAYRILWDYRYVRSVRLGNFGDIMALGYHRTARLALAYALKVQRTWTAHLDRVGLPSPPPMFEEADISIFGRDRNEEWIRLAGPVSGGAVLVRRKVSETYEELCVLTIEGEAAVYNSFGVAMRHAIEHVEELRRQAAQAPSTEKFWPSRIQKGTAIYEQFLKWQDDMGWRLGLLEMPRTISSKGPMWIVPNLIAAHFQAERHAFDKHARLVIDVARTSDRRDSEEVQNAGY